MFSIRLWDAVHGLSRFLIAGLIELENEKCSRIRMLYEWSEAKANATVERHLEIVDRWMAVTLKHFRVFDARQDPNAKAKQKFGERFTYEMRNISK